jgi:predicted membrane metal-binding protein
VLILLILCKKPNTLIYSVLLLLLLLLSSLLFLLQLSFNSVAVVLTLVQTKEIRINIHQQNNTKTQYKQYKTQYIQVHILPKHSYNCQNTPHTPSPTNYITISNNRSTRYTPNESHYNQIPSVQGHPNVCGTLGW